MVTETLPTVSVIIPAHNRVKYIDETVRSVLDQSYSAYELIVVDDGSSDGTSEYLRNEHPEFTVLAGDGNLWWTGATNLGVRYALQYARKDDRILTLNNDTVLPRTYLETMISLSRQVQNG